jgi:hypothetical protein
MKEYIVVVFGHWKKSDTMPIARIKEGQELIRCRNCKYYCGRSCTAHDAPGDYMKADDFCSWAQPKKGRKNNG